MGERHRYVLGRIVMPYEREDAMQCQCGYDFVQERINMSTGDSEAFDSYAVVNDKYYRMFIRSEIKAVQARDKAKKQAAIARSSTYVGSLFACPQCSRIVLLKPVKPGVWKREYYKKRRKRYSVGG